MIQRVAEKEIGTVPADAQQPAALEGPTEIYSPDEAELSILLANELGRDGQEEFIDAIAVDQLAKQMGTSFGEDGPIALCLKRREDLVDANAVPVGDGANLAGLR